jgi:hypothetical protein
MHFERTESTMYLKEIPMCLCALLIVVAMIEKVIINTCLLYAHLIEYSRVIDVVFHHFHLTCDAEQ